MDLRFFALPGTMLALALPAQAQVSAADRAAIRKAIEGCHLQAPDEHQA